MEHRNHLASLKSYFFLLILSYFNLLVNVIYWSVCTNKNSLIFKNTKPMTWWDSDHEALFHFFFCVFGLWWRLCLHFSVSRADLSACLFKIKRVTFPREWCCCEAEIQRKNMGHVLIGESPWRGENHEAKGETVSPSRGLGDWRVHQHNGNIIAHSTAPWYG